MRFINEKSRDPFRLALSCYRFPVVGAPGEEMIDEVEATKMVKLALDRGVNFFGCLMPGHQEACELLMGKLLAAKREDVMIAISKDLENKKSVADLVTSVESSLKNLDTEYVDYLFVEIKDPRMWISVSVQELLAKQLDALVQAGAVRHIVYSLNVHRVQLSMKIPQALVEESLADGMFCGYEPRNREMEGFLARAKEEDLFTIALCKMDPESATARKLQCRFAWGNSNVDLLMVACYSVEMLEEILDYEKECRNQVLSSIEKNFYSKISMEEFSRRKIRSSYCNACNFCLPCPENIFVSEWVKLCEDYVKSNGTGSTEQWIQGFIRHYGDPRTICTLCGECESKCPQQLPITYYMKHKKLSDLLK